MPQFVRTLKSAHKSEAMAISITKYICHNNVLLDAVPSPCQWATAGAGEENKDIKQMAAFPRIT